MKQRQYITAFSLIVALSGLTPVVAEETATATHQFPEVTHKGPVERPDYYILQPEQMNRVTAGVGISHYDIWFNRNGGLRTINETVGPLVCFDPPCM